MYEKEANSIDVSGYVEKPSGVKLTFVSAIKAHEKTAASYFQWVAVYGGVLTSTWDSKKSEAYKR